jgi:hypothetical protein
MKFVEHWESFDAKWKYLNEIKDWKLNEKCSKMEKEKLKLHSLRLASRCLPRDGNVLPFYSPCWFSYIERSRSKRDSQSESENERESESEREIEKMIDSYQLLIWNLWTIQSTLKQEKNQE